jgi:hypothetical protein
MIRIYNLKKKEVKPIKGKKSEISLKRPRERPSAFCRELIIMHAFFMQRWNQNDNKPMIKPTQPAFDHDFAS